LRKPLNGLRRLSENAHKRVARAITIAQAGFLCHDSHRVLRRFQQGPRGFSAQALNRYRGLLPRLRPL